jgi:hypothetical protein
MFSFFSEIKNAARALRTLAAFILNLIQLRFSRATKAASDFISEVVIIVKRKIENRSLQIWDLLFEKLR